MKIFIVIEYNPFVVSSASANRWLSLIEGLANMNTDIHLLIYGNYKSAKEKEEWDESGLYKKIRYRYIKNNITTNYWKIRYNKYIGDYFKQNCIIRKIHKILLSQRGIVWTDSSFMGFKIAFYLNKKNTNRIKLFLEMSEYLDIYINFDNGFFLQDIQPIVRKRFFEKKGFFVYDGIALMTNNLLTHYEGFPEPKPKLLHLPMTVDFERFDKDIKPLAEFKKPYIVYVGDMNDSKDGVDILIKSFANISKDYPSLNLYLVGKASYDTPNHKKMIEKYNLEDKVYWQGPYKREDIPAIIKNAAVLTLPRPDSKQAQGGFPTKLGEYLATGNPVCATIVGELPDYLVDGESVYFAVPGSVESFANAMRCVLKDEEKAKQIGLKGREIAQNHFNKDIQAEKLYDFMLELYNI